MTTIKMRKHKKYGYHHQLTKTEKRIKRQTDRLYKRRRELLKK